MNRDDLPVDRLGRKNWLPSVFHVTTVERLRARSRWIHLPIVATILALAVLPTSMSATEENPPNVILVMADDQGWGDVGFRDHPDLQTPVMDELAATGLCFDRFYAAAPVCSPTRGSVLTGRHPNRFGCFSWGYTLRPQEITLAEILQEHGYATGHFGKWHLGSIRAENPANPGNNGFDQWLSAPNFFENSPILSREGTAQQTAGEGSQVTVDAALEFIRQQQSQGAPFLAVVWFGSPHRPHEALPEDLALYPDLPPNLQHFYGEITAMDRALGTLRQQLQALEIAENTILWYTSDNGALPQVGSTAGLSGRKGDLGEGGLRVPSMIEWPARIEAPLRTSLPASSVDILPTILELVGISYDSPVPLDGQSLAGLLTHSMESRDEPLGFWTYPQRGIGTPSKTIMANMLAEQQLGAAPILAANEDAWKMTTSYPTDHFPGNAAWIDGDLKLVKSVGQNDSVAYKLFNLATDESESVDLAAEHLDRVESMSAELDLWQRSVVRSLNGDDYP